MNLKTVALMFSICLLAGCGDESKKADATQRPEVLRGRIVAPVISGLKYRSGSQTGVTDADGFFTYEQMYKHSNYPTVRISGLGVKQPLAAAR